MFCQIAIFIEYSGPESAFLQIQAKSEEEKKMKRRLVIFEQMNSIYKAIGWVKWYIYLYMLINLIPIE